MVSVYGQYKHESQFSMRLIESQYAQLICDKLHL